MISNFRNFFIILMFITLDGCSERVCVRGHTETIVKPGWTEHRKIGKVRIPIYHPRQKVSEFLCDHWAEV